MPDTIKDGTGAGYVVKVDSQNRLSTVTTSRTEIRHVSETSGKAYVAYTKRDFVAGSQTNENICHFKYTGSGECHIQRIIFSTDGASSKAEMFFAPTSVSGGDALVALNLNRTVGNVSETTILTGTSDITATTATANEFLDARLIINTFTYDFDGAVILGKNDSFLIKGSVASASDKMRCVIFFYEDD